MKICVQEAFNMLQEASSIIITAHVRPDGDAIGSCLAMYHALKDIGKDVQVILDDHVPELYDFLPGFGVIQMYDGQPFEADLMVLLDACPGREGRVGKCLAPILNIDHHFSNGGSADFSYIDAEASATAEILYRAFREWRIDVTEKMAYCLYVGIATDTEFFKSPATGGKVFEICADLARAGARPAEIADALSKKSFKEITELARGLGTLELYADGRVVGIFLDESFSGMELTDDLIDMIRLIKGADIATLLKYETETSCRVRLRSNTLDMSELAQKFSGGGHKEAAGATIGLHFCEAKQLLLKQCRDFIC